MSQAFQHLRGLLGAPGGTGVTDGGLLERFASHRDEAAFAELLRRHGAMVLSVCRRLLRQTQDAEDAFQATFLVLVRRAGSLKKSACLGSWLYGVACRTAWSARRSSARRQARERRLAMMLTNESGAAAPTPEPQAVLCEEVERLPDKYRAPLVLCYFHGKTNEEAARRLGCPKGTVLSRLARARDKLRRRLVKRGVILSAAGLTTVLTNQVVTAAPPAALLAATLKAASLVATGNAPAAGLAVTALTEGVLQAMFRKKLRNAAIVVICVLLAATGLTLLWTGATAHEGLPTEPSAKPNTTPQPPGKQGERPKQEAKSKTDPAGVPLEARLVAKKDTYALDLGGKTPEEFRKGIENVYPATPVVDLELEFRNSGDKEFTFVVGGSNPDIPLLLKLEGPGAVNVTLPAQNAPIARAPFTQVTLAPGKTHTLPITSLMTKRLGRDGTASYWLEPGDYTLTATYKTAVSPAPAGSKDGAELLMQGFPGFGQVTVITAPVKLKVTREKATAIPPEFRKALDLAETLELYSLDPSTPALKDEAAFHEWRVLGKTEVRKESLTQLVAAFKKGVEEADQRVSAGCYRPRHGLRATVDGKSYDFVICFECVVVLIYGGHAEKNAGFHVSRSPAQTFNRILTDAKIALPRQPGED
jgi:RNA polymerase sigma factor (sigma-70 family)